MADVILKLNCKDSKGLIYQITKLIFEHGGNITFSQQHKEELDERFFMRFKFEVDDLNRIREKFAPELKKLAESLEMEIEYSFSDERKRMAIMVSKLDHCLYDLFLRQQYGEINADIAVVISNHADLKRVVANFKIPFSHIPVEKGKKETAEQEALELLKSHKIDFIVLARYMQILTPLMVDAYPNRIINVHHGFLPAFKGANPYHQAYKKGVKLIGATSHYVTEDLDAGAIIAQETLRIDHSHSLDKVIALGRDIERKVLASAVCAHTEDRIMVYKNRTIVF